MVSVEFSLSHVIFIMYQIEQSLIVAQRSGHPEVSSAATVCNKRQAGDTDIYTLCRVNEDGTVNETAIILREGQAARIITMMEVISVAVYLRLWPLFTSLVIPNKNVQLKRLGPGTVCQLAQRHPLKHLAVCS